MKVKFNNLIPNHKLLQELQEAYLRVMHSGYFINGPEVEAFEKEWADYCQAKYCVTCGSGQQALELLLRAYHIGHGDEVIVPSWTALPTWKAVINVGAIPKPVDVDYDTMLLDSQAVGREFIHNIQNFDKVKVIIAVHLYGYRVSDIDFFENRDWPVINDAAQAHGLKNLGTAAWSFYPTKNLGAYGDGGAITTDDKEIADLVRLSRDSSRLDELQAAFLRVKLKGLDEVIEDRESIANYYEGTLTIDSDIVTPRLSGQYHQYVIRTPQRDALKAYLASKGIETLIHYPVPPHRQFMGISNGSYPVAERLSHEVLSLPIDCSQSDVEYVCEAINEYYS